MFGTSSTFSGASSTFSGRSSAAIGASSAAIGTSSAAIGTSSPTLWGPLSAPAFGASVPSFGTSVPPFGTSTPSFGTSAPSFGTSAPSTISQRPLSTSSVSHISATSPAPDSSTPSFDKRMASDDKLDATYADEYGKKLQLIERVRNEVDLGDINTPGIIVIGSQSAGKSSVLARLTGISFPTGQNLCTRTPTIVHTRVDPSIPETLSPNNGFIADVSDNAQFEGSIRCANTGQLRDAISDTSKQIVHITSPNYFDQGNDDDDACTEDTTDSPLSNNHNSGATKKIPSISPTPIHIRLARRSGPVMTLIDLPGITHLDASDDTFDIHQATVSMVRKYAADERLIILVVIPATDDFSNSEALRIAQEYDPEGKRTVGVVSKCDLVPNVSDILDKINMTRPTDIRLSLGFIAVRNRAVGDASAADIDVLERRLFTTHPLLRRLRMGQRGIRALTDKVVALQGLAVERFFGSLRAQLWDRKNIVEEKLQSMPGIPKSDDSRRDILIDILASIHARVSLLVHTEDVSVPTLNIPSRTNEMCVQFKHDIMSNLPNSLTDEYREVVRRMQAEGRGRLLPDASVDTLIGQQVREILFGGPTTRARGGIVQCATDGLVNDIMLFIVKCYESIIHDECESGNFPMLSSVICNELGLYMQQAKADCIAITTSILNAERSTCFTQNTVYTQVMREIRIITGDLLVVAASDEERRRIVSNIMTRTLPAASTDMMLSSSSVAAVESLFRQCSVLSVSPDMFAQDNITEDDYVAFLDRFIVEASTQSDVWFLMQAQFSIHAYLHVVVKRLCDVIPMVVRNALVYEAHKRFLPAVSKRLLRDLSLLEVAMRESPRDRAYRKTLEESRTKLDDVLQKMHEFGIDGRGLEDDITNGYPTATTANT